MSKRPLDLILIGEMVTYLGHIKKMLFPFPARITFGERIKKNFSFYVIEFDTFGTTIKLFFGESRSILSFIIIEIRC